MNELKVGIFTLAALASVVVMSLKITSNQSGFGKYVTYKTIVNDASGIFPKTPIKVAGINKGRIKKIDLSGNQAFIEFEVLEGVKVTRDSILKIKSVGFLGDKYLEIFIGEDKNRLEEGMSIPSQTGGGMEDLTKDASEILKDLKAIMGSVRSSIAPENQETPLKAVVNNILQITEDIKDVAASLRRVTSGNEGKLNKIIANFEKVTSNLEYHLNANYEKSLMYDLKKIGPVLDNAKDMTKDLKAMIADLKAGKGTIGKLLRDDEVIDQVSETLSGVQKIVNKVDAIQTELSLYTTYNSETSNKSEFDLTISPSPERFYLLGLSSSKIGPTSEKETTLIDENGFESRETRKEVDKNTYRFNVQIGRRIQNWSFRAGVIESSGGVGIDYNIPSWGTTFTFEAFDYQEELGPNLRLLSHVHMWNVFYAKIGFEDLVSKEDEQSITLGAGLRFTDEDLKGLIGFFL